MASSSNPSIKKDGDVQVKAQRKRNCLERLSNIIVEALERIFYRLGKLIGNHPWKTIFVSVICVLLCGIGMIRFRQENETENLWTPFGSPSVVHKKWIDNNFPAKSRYQSLIVEADNVLQPKVIQAMMDIDMKVKNISGNKYNWTSICTKLFGRICWGSSLLELWKHDEGVIRNLTYEQIVEKINSTERSPVFFGDYDVTKVLGQITRNESGFIVGAKSATMTYFIADSGNTTQGDEHVLEWESKYIDVGKEGHKDVKKVYVSSTRSFGDEGGGNIRSDIIFLSAGYGLIICYVTLVLGLFTCVNHRAWLSFSGIIVIGCSILVSFGLASAFGAPYGPVHSILPFLLLGIGVDDMFVIIQAWRNLTPEEHEHPLEERIGIMLKHAGVAITVTSITDFVAFAIGASTILPALQSFCAFACLGIIALYFLSATFFVACHTLNEKRTEVFRNACCCCYVHKDYQASACGQREPMQMFFEKIYAPLLMKTPVKITVLVITAGLLGLNIWGIINLKQNFDFKWFLASDSYLNDYYDASDRYYPSDGVSTSIYIGDIDYYKDWKYVDEIAQKAAKSRYTYEGTVDSFLTAYKKFLNESTDNRTLQYLNSDNWPRNATYFYRLLNAFVMWVPAGRKYTNSVNITETDDGEFILIASKINLKHKNLPDAQTEVKAMDDLRRITRESGLPEDKCFAYSRQYLNWEGNKVIQEELYRNIGLAFGCVFIVTLLLIANLWTSLMVLLCVVLTLVDLGGMMYLWGLTIDTVSSVQVILAIGLAVDYSAHIAHMFMTEIGTRNERALTTIGDMGPAVFNGGFSTFLAFILLAMSTSYVFTTFFKVFLGVVVYGLFHGLAFLPVLLSWIGPAPYMTAVHQHEVDEEFAREHPEKDPEHGIVNSGFGNKKFDEPPPDYDDCNLDMPPPDYTPPNSPSTNRRPMSGQKSLPLANGRSSSNAQTSYNQHINQNNSTQIWTSNAENHSPKQMVLASHNSREHLLHSESVVSLPRMTNIHI